MRYINEDTITFTDKDGNLIPVKGIREIGTYNTGSFLRVIGEMNFDEIITRQEYYGPESENLAYAVFEKNIVKMVENNFDITKLKDIEVPVIEELF